MLNSASALLTASTRRRAHGIFISSYATMGMEQSLSTTSSGGAAVFFNPILYNRDVLEVRTTSNSNQNSKVSSPDEGNEVTGFSKIKLP